MITVNRLVITGQLSQEKRKIGVGVGWGNKGPWKKGRD